MENHKEYKDYIKTSDCSHLTVDIIQKILRHTNFEELDIVMAELKYRLKMFDKAKSMLEEIKKQTSGFTSEYEVACAETKERTLEVLLERG